MKMSFRSATLVAAAAVMALAPAARGDYVFLSPPSSTISAGGSEIVSLMLVVTTPGFILGGDQAAIDFDKSKVSISNLAAGSDIVAANANGQSFTTNQPTAANLAKGVLYYTQVDSNPAGYALSAGTYDLVDFKVTALAGFTAGQSTLLDLAATATSSTNGRLTTKVANNLGTAYALDPAPLNGMDPRDAIVNVRAVPEPASMALLAIGGIGSAVVARRRKKARVVA